MAIYTITINVGNEDVRTGGKSTASIDGKGQYPITTCSFFDLHERTEQAFELLDNVLFDLKQSERVTGPLIQQLDKVKQLLC